MHTIEMIRFAYAPDGTFGYIDLPNGKRIYTCERPWLSNRQNESCIPDGAYILKKRRSPVVERTTGADFKEGWEVTGVPERTFIMIHPGNWPKNVEGCIAVGRKYQLLNGLNGVIESRSTFRCLMSALASETCWQLDIRPFRMEYP